MPSPSTAACVQCTTECYRLISAACSAYDAPEQVFVAWIMAACVASSLLGQASTRRQLPFTADTRQRCASRRRACSRVLAASDVSNCSNVWTVGSPPPLPGVVPACLAFSIPQRAGVLNAAALVCEQDDAAPSSPAPAATTCKTCGAALSSAPRGYAPEGCTRVSMHFVSHA